MKTLWLLILLAAASSALRAEDCAGYRCEAACLESILYKNAVLNPFTGAAMDIRRFEATTKLHPGSQILVPGRRRRVRGFFVFTDEQAFFAPYPKEMKGDFWGVHLRVEVPGRGPAEFYYEDHGTGEFPYAVSSDLTAGDDSRVRVRGFVPVGYDEGAGILRRALGPAVLGVGGAYQEASARYARAVARRNEGGTLSFIFGAFIPAYPEKEGYLQKLDACLSIEDEYLHELVHSTQKLIQLQRAPARAP